ncbi:hypothetical protein AJ79_06361 [Helicocarpus griseus UAMH5409]|uniref:Cytochrome P450 monooxygenase n=1 Tax=Helicocarpus griseus UAMH5409 TaxID=1447875 RepID=A0A2B7XEA9_9EURO|nr:hypothetical protein AJ79_06361 [Helicocarpus griseus UAMH5409]
MLIASVFSGLSLSSLSVEIGLAILSIIVVRCVYRIYWHPLAKFPGPAYAACFSLSSAIISVLKKEPQWIKYLAEKYGHDTPIRIQPNMLLFPQPSALKEIYWDPKCNTKSGLYGTGVLGPPHLFTTLSGDEHRELRKALGGPAWTIGSLKNNWEERFDYQVQLLVEKLNEKARTKESVVLSDKVAEFAADIMTMVSFTDPFGFVKNGRDERRILTNWREGLDFFGFVGRFKFFQTHIITLPGIAARLLPKITDETGMGWLMAEANKQVSQRESEMSKGKLQEKPDFLQHCLDARMNGEPLSPLQKRAHVTLLIQAGADTTGTALGSTLRFLVMSPEILKKAQKEIEAADAAGLLSTPVKFEEVRQHLPYFVACIKEGMRLNPPATNLFARVVGPEGKRFGEFFIPPGTEITSQSYVVQRHPKFYAPDPDAFRPERWLVSEKKANEMDAASFVFGMGPRVCIGKDIALMELYKLLPELIRRFQFDLVKAGEYVVAGGVAYNKDFIVKVNTRS